MVTAKTFNNQGWNNEISARILQALIMDDIESMGQIIDIPLQVDAIPLEDIALENLINSL